MHSLTHYPPAPSAPDKENNFVLSVIADHKESSLVFSQSQLQECVSQTTKKVAKYFHDLNSNEESTCSPVSSTEDKNYILEGIGCFPAHAIWRNSVFIGGHAAFP